MTQTIFSLTTESLVELATHSQPPLLSLYQPTHRHHPENKQDPIRFGNLVKALETSLKQQHEDAEIRVLLKPFRALEDNSDFWDHTLDGLAVLGGPTFFQVFHLPRPVVELAVAADSLHTKPLRRFLQSVDRYQVLGVSLHKIQIFEGNRDALDELELAPGVPRTLTDALGDELTEPHQTVASYGGAGSAPMRHSHSGKKDEAEIDMERFCRVIDRAVLEHHSRPSGLPLMLAALPEHHSVFRHVSHNPFLMAEGLTVNPEVLTIDELRERAWEVVEPQYEARLGILTDEFSAAKSKGLGSDKLEEVAQAAAAGRVGTLLIEADRQLPGRLDAGTGQVIVAALDHPQIDDKLDDLGELVEKMGGRVMVLPADRMPVQTGLAATYRY
jgi:hypothetical protein